jgi:hypothetical protein
VLITVDGVTSGGIVTGEVGVPEPSEGDGGNVAGLLVARWETPTLAEPQEVAASNSRVPRTTQTVLLKPRFLMGFILALTVQAGASVRRGR